MTTEKLPALKESQSLQPYDVVKQSVKELNRFYKELMQEGTDYATIPGTPKPTLLKCGAELLRLRFSFHPEFKISKGLTDIQRGFIEYDVVCSLYQMIEGNKILIAEGVGNANSLESKWRYRWLNVWELPQDFDKATAFKTHGLTRKTKKGTYQYRFDNENPQDQANTILKIGKKRSFVDSILTATGASRIFTQDIEEMAEDILESEEVGGSPIEPTENPIVAAAKQAGAIILPNIPKLNTKYGVNQEFCWLKEHDNATWKPNKFGKSYHRFDDGFCNFNEVIKPIVAELAQAKGWDANGMTEEIKKRYAGRTWSKLTETEQCEFLESLIEE